jgi:pectinesterase
MNKYFFYFLFCFLFCQSSIISAQKKLDNPELKEAATSKYNEQQASAEDIRVAENILLYQRNVGGWPKNKDMHLTLTKNQKEELLKLQSVGIGATIDNGATVKELDFLSKIYEKVQDVRYKKAFLKGINYLIEAQYENGGWPQFYPLEKGDYSTQITYNDNAMVNVMNVMKAIAEKSDRFSIGLDDATILKAKTAFEKGVEIILKTQYKQNGVLTTWCAQHDEKTLLPAKARSYELPSLSGGESPGIVLLLMSIDNPSPEIINSIQSAVTWFNKVKIKGIRMEEFTNQQGLQDRKVVSDEKAPALWARFYELENNRPFFCDRDGIKKYTIAEIGPERRNGYNWYTSGPQRVIDAYEKWQPKWAPEKNVIMN